MPFESEPLADILLFSSTTTMTTRSGLAQIQIKINDGSTKIGSTLYTAVVLQLSLLLLSGSLISRS